MTEHTRLDPETGGLLVSAEAWQAMLDRTGADADDVGNSGNASWQALTDDRIEVP